MSSPVQLSDLDVAGVANDADVTLLRKDGTTDYQVTAAILRNINIPGLSVATNPAATDLTILSQSGTNNQIYFGQVGFVTGVTCWFYNSAVPNGTSPAFWQVVSMGDALLSVGGSTYTTPGTNQGNWQQQGVGGGTPGGGLSLNQIPQHIHNVGINPISYNQGGRPISVVDTSGSPTSTYPTQGISGSTNTGNACLPHNHGNAWRPYAAVGRLCAKIL
jgi:hypothetical protein